MKDCEFHCRAPPWASVAVMGLTFALTGEEDGESDGVATQNVQQVSVKDISTSGNGQNEAAQKKELLICFMSVQFKKVYCFVMLFYNKSFKKDVTSELNLCNAEFK